MASGNQRRDAARRKLEAELAQRQVTQTQRRGQMVKFTIAGSIAVVLVAIIVVAIMVGGDEKSKDASASPSTSPSTSPSPTTSGTPTPGNCDFTASGEAAKKVNPPAATDNPVTGTTDVTFDTSAGTFVLQLDRAAAPCTAASFASLTQQKYFDDTKCHRLTTEGIYVLQCGDPTATGTGGPGYTIPDEVTGAETYPAGTVAMANTGQPHSGGSQFFIVTKDSSQGLGTGKYAVFGKITKGLDVVQKVAAAGTDNGTGDGAPKTPVEIKSASIG